jgi:prevent-host-death family protein
MAVKVVGTRQLRDELAAMIGALDDLDEVVITQRGEGRAILVGIERYNALVERLEFLEDTLDALEGEREGAVPVDTVF